MAVASYLNRILTALSERERRLSRGESLFHDGDPVVSLFLVVAGELRVTLLQPHGVELTLQRPTAGAIVNESSLFAERYACDAGAACPSTVRAVPVHRVLAAFRGSCELVHSWARHLEGELHRARTQAEILSLKTVAERLDAWCALSSGALPPRGRWHQLAEEIGVSAEALYRELARRRARGSGKSSGNESGRVGRVSTFGRGTLGEALLGGPLQPPERVSRNGTELAPQNRSQEGAAPTRWQGEAAVIADAALNLADL